MNVNGQDVIEAKLKTEEPALVAGMVAAKVAGPVEQYGPLGHDVWIYRMVVGLLGVVLIIATLGGLIIAMAGKGPVPDVVVAMGSGAVGALAGLLAPSPAGRQ
jgi:hypothetical protein